MFYQPIKTLLVIAFAATATLTACVTQDNNNNKQAANSNQVISSPYDNRQYRAITLDNGLEVILVSDPETEKSAASLAVGVGSMHNPIEQQGLAHFLEHMLFLGTEKYPVPDEYSEFMSRHGGMHNAYTADDHTNYMFQINNNAFDEALDRFSDFFKSPLFTAEYVEKEVNAVHSEWSMNKASDGWNLFALNNVTLNPEHPMSKFNIGNNESLGDKEGSSLLATMKNFYQSYYSANIMTAALASHLSLDELEVLARSHFSDIPNFQAQVPEIEVAPVTDKEKALLVAYQPQLEMRNLFIDFTLPNMGSDYASKPIELVSYVIASEMPGTPAALLREAGLIEYMSSYGEPDNYGNAGRLRVMLGLTEQGYAYKELVLGFVFRYLERIQEAGISEAYAQELRTVLQNDFQFLERQSAFSYVSELAASLQDTPAQHVVNKDYLLTHFDAQATQVVLDHLSPDNARVFVVGPDVEGDTQIEHYVGRYTAMPLLQEQVELWKGFAADIPVSLPELNRFLPEDLSIVAGEPTETPIVIYDDAGVSVLYQRSTRFAEPRAEVSVNYHQSLDGLSLKQNLATQAYLYSFYLSHAGLAQEASVAGVGFDIETKHGFELSLSGFNDKQAVLASMLLDRLVAFVPSVDQLEQTKSLLRRQVENKKHSTPVSLVGGLYSQASGQPHFYSDKETLAALQGLTIEDVETARDFLFKDVLVRGFVYGNYSKTDAIALIKQAAQYATVKPTVQFQEHSQIRALEDYPVVVHARTSQSDSALLTSYIAQETPMKTRLAVSILRTIAHNRFFNQLRTEEQLAYALGATGLNLEERLGLGFYIQSPVKGTAELAQRVDEFTADFGKYLNTLSDERFEEAKESLKTELSQPTQGLTEEAARVRSEWRKKEPLFDRRAQQLSLLEELNKDDLKAAYQALIGEQAYRVRIEVQGESFKETEYAPTQGWTVLQD